jgi:hypothetical protein
MRNIVLRQHSVLLRSASVVHRFGTVHLLETLTAARPECPLICHFSSSMRDTSAASTQITASGTLPPKLILTVPQTRLSSAFARSVAVAATAPRNLFPSLGRDCPSSICLRMPELHRPISEGLYLRAVYNPLDYSIRGQVYEAMDSKFCGFGDVFTVATVCYLEGVIRFCPRAGPTHKYSAKCRPLLGSTYETPSIHVGMIEITQLAMLSARISSSAFLSLGVIEHGNEFGRL